MEFKEVEGINKEVIVKIKDRIYLKDLIHYMESWGFSTMVIQGIEADIRNNGVAYAVMPFLDAVKKRPGSFPKLVAALEHTGQKGIRQIFMKEIRKYYRNKQTRLAEVLSLIEAEDRKLSEDHQDDDDGGHSHHSQQFASGNGASQQGLLFGYPDRQPSNNPPSSSERSQDIIYRRTAGQPPSRDPPKSRGASDSQLVVQAQGRSKSQAASSSSSLSSLDNNIPGATGNTGRGIHNQSLPSEIPAQLDPNYAGKSISSLKAKVYKMLGQALEKKNTQGDDDEPWWNHIINDGDLNVSRREQKRIGKLGSPGVEFLDILDDRGYTLQDLERLFIQFRIDEALDILRLHQNKVIEGRQYVPTDQNNLNTTQEAKADPSKTLNISLLQTDGPEGPSQHSASSMQPLPQQADAGGANRNSDVQLVTQTSDLSLDSNTSYSLPSIQDEPIKGTTAVLAHGYPTGEQSQPSPGQDAQKLRNDRVHQFDNDPEALERTSFIAVGSQQGTGNNDATRNIPVVPYDSGGQMGSSSFIQRNTDVENANSPSVHVSQGEPSGNIPMLSQLGSMDSGTEEQPEDPSIRPEGIVNVLPRSFTAFEASSNGAPQTGRVTVVYPSVDSTSSREVTEEDNCNTQSEAASNLSLGSDASSNGAPQIGRVTFVYPSVDSTSSREVTEEDNCNTQSEAASNLSLGSLIEPDLIQDSHLGRTETTDDSVSFDLHENSDK